jgi:protein gp37
MGKTSIEWTDASWNPIVGCTEVSPGCANCYAARLAATRLKGTPAYSGLVKIIDVDATPQRWHWNGDVRFLPERLEEPLHWRKPRRIFVCDMGDLFHESVSDEWIDQVFAKVVDCQQHTFQILTKRAQRMHDYLCNVSADRIRQHLNGPGTLAWPWRNVWLGVSVENQHFAEERIPLLLSTPAAVRFISVEPLLGPLTFAPAFEVSKYPQALGRGIDWVICGGESGPNARPMHPDWARSLRDQCVAAGVPFFFKQWGEYVPCKLCCGNEHVHESIRPDGVMAKVGKKRAGRLLDGREWSEFPKWR